MLIVTVVLSAAVVFPIVLNLFVSDARARREWRASLFGERRREFECFYNFLGWWHWSFGLHVDLRHPHVDLHLPFGYLRIGWFRCWTNEEFATLQRPRAFGWSPMRRRIDGF
jgi:hypothetical protein